MGLELRFKLRYSVASRLEGGRWSCRAGPGANLKLLALCLAARGEDEGASGW
jgi:hypothetical protein